MKSKFLVMISVLALALFLFACSETSEVAEAPEEVAEAQEDDAEETEEESSDIEDSAETEDAPEEEAASEVVEIKTVGVTFTPDTVTIKAGDSVLFDVGGSHNVVEVSQETWDAGQKDALESGFGVDFGEEKEISFDTPGTYYYVCAPHAAMGMKGMVVVE